MAKANGKIILFGEHAVVYGRRAIAASLPIPIETRVVKAEGTKARLHIPTWDLNHHVTELPEFSKTLDQAVDKLLSLTGLSGKGMVIEVTPHLTSGVGLGSSAAVSVSILRGLDETFGLKLSDDTICKYAFEAEKIFHGNPSGLDNTISTYGGMILYRRGEPAIMERIGARMSLPLVVALTGRAGDTKSMVAGVRERHDHNPTGYDFLFDAVDRTVERALQALKENDIETLGLLMTYNHGILQTMGVSTKELDLLAYTARSQGAYGAKLTGAGGGGAMVALVPQEKGDTIVQSIRGLGFQAFFSTLTVRPPAA